MRSAPAHVRRSRQAERLGADQVWLGEHVYRVLHLSLSASLSVSLCTRRTLTPCACPNGGFCAAGGPGRQHRHHHGVGQEDHAGVRQDGLRIPAPADGPQQLYEPERALGVQGGGGWHVDQRRLRKDAQRDHPRSVPGGVVPLRPQGCQRHQRRAAHLPAHVVPNHCQPRPDSGRGRWAHAAALRRGRLADGCLRQRSLGRLEHWRLQRLLIRHHRGLSASVSLSLSLPLSVCLCLTVSVLLSLSRR